MSLIKKVQSLEDYNVLVQLSNGHSIILNFECKLNTMRFNQLENLDVFKKVATDGSSLIWNGGRLKVNFTEVIQMTQVINTSVLQAV